MQVSLPAAKNSKPGYFNPSKRQAEAAKEAEDYFWKETVTTNCLLFQTAFQLYSFILLNLAEVWLTWASASCIKKQPCIQKQVLAWINMVNHSFVIAWQLWKLKYMKLYWSLSSSELT